MPRISQLPALTVPEANDEIAIVDASAATTKKITRADFLKGAALPADTVDTQAIANSAVTHGKVDWSDIHIELFQDLSLVAITGTMAKLHEFTVPEDGLYIIGGTCRIQVGANGWIISRYVYDSANYGYTQVIAYSSATYISSNTQSITMYLEKGKKISYEAQASGSFTAQADRPDANYFKIIRIG